MNTTSKKPKNEQPKVKTFDWDELKPLFNGRPAQPHTANSDVESPKKQLVTTCAPVDCSLDCS